LEGSRRNERVDVLVAVLEEDWLAPVTPRCHMMRAIRAMAGCWQGRKKREYWTCHRILPILPEQKGNIGPVTEFGRIRSPNSPNSRPIEAEGIIVSRPMLGGLHHRYGRAAPK